MAKKSSIEKNDRRKATVAKYAEKRRKLKAILSDRNASEADRAKAYAALMKLPRDASPVRVRNRCSMTGRSRAYIGTFGLGRMAFRDMALNGLIPGVRKASW
ncbi:MAG: 30S ribosomal protein S14 [Gemmatimonadetes bacterium]|nr:30S ribosomal protein S14 [Gemmatimonadota bacterium]